MHLQEFEALADLPGVQLVSLQTGPGREQIQKNHGSDNLLDPHDVRAVATADLAAIMAHLDLVISVDTAVAHLAGAVGTKLWIALAKLNDWRWMKGRSDSPWYPQAHLYRQKKLGAWRSVVLSMRSNLQQLVDKGACSKTSGSN
jgi:ADP-heptose:LPS heptosyltransferase